MTGAPASVSPMQESGPTVDSDALYALADEAREHAYAPYSGFSVGAALITEDGTIFKGTNVENASLGLSMCAERVAAFQAVAAGHRRFAALAVAAGSSDAPPCGACRQVLTEFGREDLSITFTVSGEIVTRTLAELQPFPFRLREQPQEPGPSSVPE
jgi:cytidine deaminase